jgi:sugar-specific transcriptional regulator TrmB
MLKTLENLGFKKQDVEVYVFLVLNGPKNAKNIAGVLRINKRQIYRILKKLQAKQIINTTPNHSTQYSSVPFDKVLDKLIKVNIEEASRIEEKKSEIFELWKSNITKEPLS